MNEQGCKSDSESEAHIIPFPRRPEHDQMQTETVDVATLNDTEIISYTLVKLRHPATQPENTAHRLIAILAGGESDNDKALARRLQQIIDKPILTDELYDEMEENDELFRRMTEFMRETKAKDPSELRIERRKAVLTLMELYAFSLVDEPDSQLPEEVERVFDELIHDLSEDT